MDTEKIVDELGIEVYATNDEGETMIAKKVIGEKGVFETFMDVYNKLMKIEKDKKWEIKLVRVRNLKNVYYNKSKEKEV